jgi:hypothetical protein
MVRQLSILIQVPTSDCPMLKRERERQEEELEEGDRIAALLSCQTPQTTVGAEDGQTESGDAVVIDRPRPFLAVARMGPLWWSWMMTVVLPLSKSSPPDVGGLWR